MRKIFFLSLIIGVFGIFIIFQKAETQIPQSLTPRVLAISYLPPDPSNTTIMDKVISGENTSITQKETAINNLITSMLTFASIATKYHGYNQPNTPQYLTYQLAENKVIYSAIPKGYLLKATENIYRPNYGKILLDNSICNYVDNQNVKEVWMFGYHYGQIEPDESRMSSKYGDFSNSRPKETDPAYPSTFRLPKCNHSYILYNFNYQRTLPEMIHNRLHQVENTFYYIDKSTFWGDFSEYIQYPGGCTAALQQDPGRVCRENHNYRSSCGNAHFTPNWRTSADDYKYSIPDQKESNCETWNPDESQSTFKSFGCAEWGCTDVGYYTWFLQNLPGYNNCIAYQGKYMRNWWDAMYDFDGFIDKGKSLYSNVSSCQPTPTITPTTRPVQLSCDPNLDGKIDILDFYVWRDEYTKVKLSKTTDCFKPDGKIDLLDFQAWKNKTS